MKRSEKKRIIYNMIIANLQNENYKEVKELVKKFAYEDFVKVNYNWTILCSINQKEESKRLAELILNNNWAEFEKRGE